MDVWAENGGCKQSGAAVPIFKADMDSTTGQRTGLCNAVLSVPVLTGNLRE